jgi:hypothetical protein
MCSRTVSVSFHFFFLFSFFFQLKSLFEIFTFVSEWSIKYQYLILTSLILVACYRNSFSRFGSIQLRLINKFNSDFESYFMSVSNFRLVCLLPIYFYFTEINIDNGVANTVKYLQNMWCVRQATQHYVIKFVSDLPQVGGFLRVLRFPPAIKLTATILS